MHYRRFLSEDDPSLGFGSPTERHRGRGNVYIVSKASKTGPPAVGCEQGETCLRFQPTEFRRNVKQGPEAVPPPPTELPSPNRGNASLCRPGRNRGDRLSRWEARLASRGSISLFARDLAVSTSDRPQDLLANTDEGLAAHRRRCRLDGCCGTLRCCPVLLRLLLLLALEAGNASIIMDAPYCKR